MAKLFFRYVCLFISGIVISGVARSRECSSPSFLVVLAALTQWCATASKGFPWFRDISACNSTLIILQILGVSWSCILSVSFVCNVDLLRSNLVYVIGRYCIDVAVLAGLTIGIVGSVFMAKITLFLCILIWARVLWGMVQIVLLQLVVSGRKIWGHHFLWLLFLALE